MSGRVSPSMPWRIRLKLHMSVIAAALPFTMLVAVEARDMYYRATWEVETVRSDAFRTGDVIAISNRWYTLPTWSQCAYSFFSKVCLKAVWDDLAVIVTDGTTPSVLYCTMNEVRREPLQEFLAARCPRGVAVRQIRMETESPRAAPTADVAEIFIREVSKMTPSPWYLFRASWRSAAERTYFNYMYEFNKAKTQFRALARGELGPSGERHTKQGIQAAAKRLEDMEIMRQNLEEKLPKFDSFYLFNGSLVASFLATFDLIDREAPAVTRYVPQDFAHDIPMKFSTLGDPVVIYKN
jgi:hypothetical protein